MRGILRDGKFVYATAVLVGTMVGVGIFGIPFAFAKAGFWVGTAWLVGLALIVILFDLVFAELVLSSPGTHQVVGYINIWLGPLGRALMTCALLISMYGALLAYMIVSGEFLHNVLSQFLAVNPQWYSIGFASMLSLMWFIRLRTMAVFEIVLVGLYASIIAVIAGIGFPHIQWDHITAWTPEYWHLPYGVLLFAFAGMSAIPLQRELLSGRERLMRPAIITAVSIVAVLYLIFAFTIVGISGDITSPESFAGLFGTFGMPVIILGSCLGLLTMTTSYILLGTALFETFHRDYRIRPIHAWMLTLVPPLLMFVSGLRNFIDVIGLVGAVAIGFQSVLVLIAYVRSRKNRLRTPEFNIPIPSLLVWCLALIFLAGVVFELMLR